MPRPEGFPIADIDVGLFSDPKVKALWRELRDPSQMAIALQLYLAALLESWSDGTRATIDDAAPPWVEEISDETRSALRKVKLIDAESRVSRSGWDQWFGPAATRRQARQEAGRRGGLASHGKQASVDQGSSAAGRVPDPTVLTEGRESPNGLQNGRSEPKRTTRASAPERLGDILRRTAGDGSVS